MPCWVNGIRKLDTFWVGGGRFGGVGREGSSGSLTGSEAIEKLPGAQISLRNLVESLEAAERKGQLRRRLGILTYPALLVVDEIGYLPVTRNGATLFPKRSLPPWASASRPHSHSRESRRC